MSDTNVTPTADTQLYQLLTQVIGQWSQATGVAPPPPSQVAAWVKQYGGGMSGNLEVEAQNIGWYNQHDPNLPHTTGADILKAAQADPRWASLDQTGRDILEQFYNLQQMGYGGNIGTNTPLPAETPGPSGDTGIQGAQPNGMSSTQMDAWAQLQQTLAAYGFSGADLTALVAWAKNEIISGNSATQVSLDLMQTPQFKARFPAIGALAGEGVAITPSEYISLEQQYAQLEHAAGLPPNFASYDALIAGQVSPSEYSDRLTKGYLAVSTAPPEVMQAMHDYYGTTQGDLAAYFLNPNQSSATLQQQALAAQIGGASAVSGFGQVNVNQAQRLAQMGVSYAQAQQGFQTLSGQQQLYSNLPGQGSRYAFTPDNLLGAEFGSDGQTKLQLQIQADMEKNFFNQGTGVGQSSGGLTGAGVEQR